MTSTETSEFHIAEQVAYYLDSLTPEKQAQVMALLMQRYKIAVPKANLQYRKSTAYKHGPKNIYRSNRK